jgi:hypothetical protein
MIPEIPRTASDAAYPELVGASPAMAALVDRIRRVAPHASTVLVTGGDRHREGTGRARASQPGAAGGPAAHRRQASFLLPRVLASATSPWHQPSCTLSAPREVRAGRVTL